MKNLGGVLELLLGIEARNYAQVRAMDKVLIINTGKSLEIRPSSLA